MGFDMNNRIIRRLDRLKKQGQGRVIRRVESIAGEGMRVILSDGEKAYEAVNFCSNDYLGFASERRIHPTMEPCFSAGAGSGSSRLIGGTTEVHQRFETEIAGFLEKEAALLFPSGYQANLGVLAAVSEVFPFIISDRLNHASLIDGCRLARAELRIIDHRDLEGLEKAIEVSASTPLVVIEGLYSMDGSVYDFAGLAELKERHPFVLMVDEAHGFGVYGPEGRGIAAESEALSLVDIYVGTLSKACGLSGAFVASSRHLIDLLINRARSFIFSTAISPLQACLAGQALAAVRESDNLREKLQTHVRAFRSALEEGGIPLPGAPFSAIAPIVVGESEETLALSQLLLERGFFVQAIRPPTVMEGTSRLRVSLSAAHRMQDVQSLAAAVLEIMAGRL